jgi:RNA polymerase sigma-70 factor, ECF subfamily
METPASLLERLRQPADEAAWGRFVNLYTPLLFHWAGRLGVKSPDATDLVQDVLLVLVQKLPGFHYNPDKTFRGWLWTVTLNKWREKQRHRAADVLEPNAAVFAALESPDGAAAFAEEEYRQYLVQRALRLMQAEFHASTWKAFWEFAIRARPAAEVGAELGLSLEAVYTAKSRVLRRLRRELNGLLA